ncbi:hypothetical protein [Bremerella alba]|uniref:Uncharacterized protein n=1 Tax=Bremerella alba TaxID=980252 RepID=A0A7V8V8J5_9BACT|nr:hypothetical protein [Bremerella alba]MBA2116935.1 hypothetical protein [Bremerella alba]
MDAIVEVIGAIFQFFVYACIYVADICIRAVWFSIDSIRYGYKGALQRNEQRRKDEFTPFATRIGGAVIFFGTVFISLSLLAWWQSHHQQKVDQTERLVDRLAEKYYQQTTEDDPVFQNGPLSEQDAWGQPVRLDTEKSLMGWWIVVSSDGPDGRPSTSDDVEAIRSNWANLEQVGGELAERGSNAIKQKLKGMFSGDDSDQPKEAVVLLAEEGAPAENLPMDDESVATEPNQANAEEKKGWKLPSIKFRWGKKDE